MKSIVKWLKGRMQRKKRKLQHPPRGCARLEMMDKRLRALEAKASNLLEQGGEKNAPTTAQVLDEWLNGKEKRE